MRSSTSRTSTIKVRSPRREHQLNLIRCALHLIQKLEWMDIFFQSVFGRKRNVIPQRGFRKKRTAVRSNVRPKLWRPCRHLPWWTKRALCEWKLKCYLYLDLKQSKACRLVRGICDSRMSETNRFSYSLYKNSFRDLELVVLQSCSAYCKVGWSQFWPHLTVPSKLSLFYVSWQGLLAESKRSSREAVQKLEKKNRDLSQTLQSLQCDLERTLKREQVGQWSKSRKCSFVIWLRHQIDKLKFWFITV